MIFGLLLAVLASLCFGISVAIQKYSLNEIKNFSLKQMIKSKKWVSALGIGIVGVVIYLVALNLEPISTVQPLTSLSFIIPIIAGIAFFKEKLEVKKWAFLVLVLAGIVLVTIF